MRPDLTPPPKLSPGDRVAVLSLSFAAPAVFPAVHEQAMRRLRAEFGLEPVEYPTTRRLNADPRDRAADLMAAFADPGIAGLLATIGGDDLLTVLPFLDPELVVANPKPLAGYSDNTNLLNWLWNLGLASWHGGSIMVDLGRGGGLNPPAASPPTTDPARSRTLRSSAQPPEPSRSHQPGRPIPQASHLPRGSLPVWVPTHPMAPSGAP
jgi:hypothetical protein